MCNNLYRTYSQILRELTSSQVTALSNSTNCLSSPDGSTGTETGPTSDVTNVEAQTTFSVPTSTSKPELTSTPSNTANSSNFNYESTSTCVESIPSVTPVEYAANSTPKRTCYDCNGLRKKCYLLSRKNKRLKNRPTLGPNVAAIICEIWRYWAILGDISKNL